MANTAKTTYSNLAAMASSARWEHFDTYQPAAPLAA